MEKFTQLSEEKQTSVLNAAFSCFGKTGYRKTSIADIAAAAGISKASVFQYFGTKKDLYLHLFKYAGDKIIKEVPAGTDDFFECLQISSEIKIRVTAKHPGMFDYLSSLVSETDAEILSEMKKLNERRVSEALGRLFVNVNWDKFKPGIDREMAVNAVRWVNEGYLKSVEKRENNVEEIQKKLWQYMNLLKIALYKEEYL